MTPTTQPSSSAPSVTSLAEDSCRASLKRKGQLGPSEGDRDQGVRKQTSRVALPLALEGWPSGSNLESSKAVPSRDLILALETKLYAGVSVDYHA
jgi:hypothetical protein